MSAKDQDRTMIKQLAIAVALSGALAGSVMAQTAAAPTDAPAVGQPVPAVQTPVVPTATQESQAAAPAGDLAEIKETATPGDCLQVANDLAVNAGASQIADDKLEKIDDLLIAMETHCDARQFPEAHAVATNIRSMIETR